MSEDIDIEAMAKGLFFGIPEYPGHSQKRVGTMYRVYSRIGDTAFRGESTEGFAPALDDLADYISRWRARR